MNIAIKRLCPELAQTYINYLSHLDFSHEPHWSSCLCRFYHMNNDMDVWVKRTFEENKADAIEAILAGTMDGYLAFDGEQCIGWHNANNTVAYLRLEEYLTPYVGSQKIGLAICYVIHPNYRHQGVAKALLAQAITNFRDEEYDAVIALPIAEDSFSEKQYRGTVSMYEKAGFKTMEIIENMHIMRLELKGKD